jgi:hypothetical protein
LTTTFAAGAHDFAVFQVVNEIIGFGYSGKTNGPEFLKAIINLFGFTHIFSPFVINLDTGASRRFILKIEQRSQNPKKYINLINSTFYDQGFGSSRL